MALATGPGCGKEISDQAPACPDCGQPATPAPQPIPQPTTPTAKKNRGCGTAIVLIILGFIIVVALGLLLARISCGNAALQGHTPSSSLAGVGREGHLRTEGSSPSVPVAETKRALDEMVSAKSDRAIAALILGGGGFLVDQGTRIAVVESSGLGARRIRILDGPMAGRTGYVPDEWCRE